MMRLPKSVNVAGRGSGEACFDGLATPLHAVAGGAFLSAKLPGSQGH
jgi:hypothetical protein